MIAFGAFLFVYLLIGWVVAYEAHKRDWNSRLARWDQAGHMGWWLMWWFRGAPIFNELLGERMARFGNWAQDTLDRLFDRMTEFNWRRNGTENES